MKRIIFLMVIALAVTVSVAAQSYTVQSVSGRVQREAGNNRIDIVVGDVLPSSTVIHTGIGSSMVLTEGERTYNVLAAQNGRVADLVTRSSNIRVSGNVTVVDTSTGRRTGQISTASARASDAAADDDIAAE
jgi:hypothetical protein